MSFDDVLLKANRFVVVDDGTLLLFVVVWLSFLLLFATNNLGVCIEVEVAVAFVATPVVDENFGFVVVVVVVVAVFDER